MERMPFEHQSLASSHSQRRSLQRLANYLMEQVNADKFDIRNYVNGTDPATWRLYVFPPYNLKVVEYREILATEGTKACPIGYGPAAGIAVPSADMSWEEYGCLRFTNCRICSDWMFSRHWHAVDPTVVGAANRIQYALEHGLPFRFHIDKKGEISVPVRDYKYYVKGGRLAA